MCVNEYVSEIHIAHERYSISRASAGLPSSASLPVQIRSVRLNARDGSQEISNSCLKLILIIAQLSSDFSGLSCTSSTLAEYYSLRNFLSVPLHIVAKSWTRPECAPQTSMVIAPPSRESLGKSQGAYSHTTGTNGGELVTSLIFKYSFVPTLTSPNCKVLCINTRQRVRS